MKILTEIEQLERRYNELWALIRFNQELITDKHNLRRSLESRWFVPKDKLKVLYAEIEKLDSIDQALIEYRNELDDRVGELKKKAKELSMVATNSSCTL